MKTDFPYPKPTLEICKSYIAEKKKLLENEYYERQEQATLKLFSIFPNNTNLNEILLKSAAINQFYSCNVRKLYQVAKLILNLKIDTDLKAGKLELIDEIDFAAKNTEEVNQSIYVFATKYCALHNLKVFPIYDNKAGEALVAINSKYHFAEFTKKDELRNYKFFYQVYQKFIEIFDLKELTFRQIDLYLWNLGKDLSKKTENKKTSNKKSRRN